MSNEKLDLIENSLKAKNIEEYEIYLVDKEIYETIFLKNNIDNERQARGFKFFLRILEQKPETTGIGVILGSSLDPNQLKKDIDICKKIAKMNSSPKYHFPDKKSIKSINSADPKVISDPIGTKQRYCEELISEALNQKDVQTTFGRFRIHKNHKFLRNSNGINLDSMKTFFFVEFAFKAEKNDSLSEFWDYTYYKEKEHLNFSKRVEHWAKRAKDTLIAQQPISNDNAIVIFTPEVLQSALSPIEVHSLGEAHYEKISSFDIGEKVASTEFSLVDNGLLEGGMGTGAWDGEGNPQQKTEVIIKGIFKNRLYDQKYSLLEATNPTGNAKRTENGGVSNGVTNLEILAGSINLEEMISNIDDGYYIDKFSWLRPDPISGSFGAEIRNGYIIKNGELTTPIKLGNVSGNSLEMIKNCLYISKEREFSQNTLFPYIAFSNLNVSS
ncbi:MAG: TldD/PmbA family protein [Promethearchaeota archaeon]|nr:MAG: TldD/PmbA family protein [Candidatus Lokiarchaeota archaeon]